MISFFLFVGFEYTCVSFVEDFVQLQEGDVGFVLFFFLLHLNYGSNKFN